MYSKRQELILDFIKDNPNTKREDIEMFLIKMGHEATKMTITRDLKLLLENNDIEKSGLAKATVYNPSIKANLLNDINIETYFNKDQDERLPNSIGFNFEVFSALTDLLTPKEKIELENLNNTYTEKRNKLSPNLLQKEFERLTVELAWKSSKIEGNTYTLLDTERLLNENISAEGKTKEMVSFVKAFNFDKSVLVILNEHQSLVKRAARNLEKVDTITAELLSTYEVVVNQKVVMTKAAVEKFQEVNG